MLQRLLKFCCNIHTNENLLISPSFVHAIISFSFIDLSSSSNNAWMLSSNKVTIWNINRQVFFLAEKWDSSPLWSKRLLLVGTSLLPSAAVLLFASEISNQDGRRTTKPCCTTAADLTEEFECAQERADSAFPTADSQNPWTLVTVWAQESEGAHLLS